MVNHTMIVSFNEPLPDAELDQFLAHIEKAMLDFGFAQSVSSRRHLPVPGEQEIPALIATAIIQFGLADMDALTQSFAAPGVHEVIEHWQARHPYRVAWANHEPLA